MEEKLEKAKEWVKENKKEVLMAVVTGISVMAGVKIYRHGISVGTDRAVIAMARGLSDYHKDGYLKFFDPEQAKEISSEEMLEIIREKY